MIKYDRLAKFVTVAVWVGVTFIFIRNIFACRFDILKLLSLNILLVIVLIVPYLFSLRDVRVADGCIVIKRVLGKITIPFENVAKVNLLPSIGLFRVRLLGSFGLYGYFGYFYIPKLGLVRMYATRLHDLVLIECKDGRKFIVSPKDSYKFVEEFFL